MATWWAGRWGTARQSWSTNNPTGNTEKVRGDGEENENPGTVNTPTNAPTNDVSWYKEGKGGVEDGREERGVSAVSHRPSGVEETIRPSEPENGQVSRAHSWRSRFQKREREAGGNHPALGQPERRETAGQATLAKPKTGRLNWLGGGASMSTSTAT